VPVREQEMAELNRDYGVSKEHYQSLLDKAFSAQMAADLEQKQEAEHFTVRMPLPFRKSRLNRSAVFCFPSFWSRLSRCRWALPT
jgi:hypothetical protein